jgi:hypothetical protein
MVFYSLVKDPRVWPGHKDAPLPVTGALRRRVTNGATFLGRTPLALARRAKKSFSRAIFGLVRAARMDD